MVERLSADGEGVASWNGRALFVPGALAGEEVRVAPETAGKVQRGFLLEVLRESPDRIAPECPLAGRCGGCDWLHLRPSAQRLAREQALAAALTRLGGLDLSGVEWLPTLAEGDLGTRRRADFHWDGRALGFRTRRTHLDVAVEHCPALVGPLSELPGRLAPLLLPLRRTLRSVELLAEGAQTAVALHLQGAVRPRAREVALAVLRAGVRGVVLVPESGSPVDVGRPTLRARAPLRPDVPLFLRPEVFAQAHGAATPLLVERALALLRPESQEDALELHAGIGTFTFALAARVASVTAVESAGAAVRLASAAAAEGRVGNVRFVQGDAARVGEGLAREGRRFALLLADPPRTGAPRLAEVARSLEVERLVYVACDAGALARDAARLVEADFRPEAVQLVDMFPGTHHLEAVMSFSRRPGSERAQAA
jgi:23S rRNA (uracil1939-C5)-methyltransferase